MANITAVFYNNADQFVAAKLTPNSPANAHALRIPMQSFIGSDGTPKEAPMTVKLVERAFGLNIPVRGEIFAIEIDPDAIRVAPNCSKGKEMMLCSNFKLLALGKEAVEKLLAHPATAVPVANASSLPFTPDPA
jgi:hypothetical protein